MELAKNITLQKSWLILGTFTEQLQEVNINRIMFVFPSDSN